MDPLRRANLVQKIIFLLKDMTGRPIWYSADKLVTEVILPELERLRTEYVKLFYSNSDHDKQN